MTEIQKIGIPEEEYARIAELLGCQVPSIKAVAEVESAGSGFLPDGRPKILFEAHIFSKLTKGKYDLTHPMISAPRWDRKLYKGGAKEYDRLTQALNLEPELGFHAASWGKFQIMGFNFKQCGFPSVHDFVLANQVSETQQLEIFATFMKNDPKLISAIKARNWGVFARLYNGPGYKKNEYDKKLMLSYIKYLNK